MGFEQQRGKRIQRRFERNEEKEQSDEERNETGDRKLRAQYRLEAQPSTQIDSSRYQEKCDNGWAKGPGSNRGCGNALHLNSKSGRGAAHGSRIAGYHRIARGRPRFGM
jgi:hypothetical protein